MSGSSYQLPDGDAIFLALEAPNALSHVGSLAVLDPSTPQRRLTSKMIIDATRQFPEEGGPDPWPSLSRDILEQQYPTAFEQVDAKWDDYWDAGLEK